MLNKMTLCDEVAVWSGQEYADFQSKVASTALTCPFVILSTCVTILFISFIRLDCLLVCLLFPYCLGSRLFFISDTTRYDITASWTLSQMGRFEIGLRSTIVSTGDYFSSNLRDHLNFVTIRPCTSSYKFDASLPAPIACFCYPGSKAQASLISAILSVTVCKIQFSI